MLASVWVGIGGARRSTSSRRRKRLWGDGAAATRTYLRARPTGTSNQKGRSMAVIEVRGLTKRFGPVLAVDRLSFEVDRGTVVGFLGPNGAGKTTTLRALLGLVRPTAGTATIHGRAYCDLPDPLRHVGAVLEASSFYPSRRARNHLRVQAMAGVLDPARVEEVLELVGLERDARRQVGGFSLGMRQRLGIATAMLGDPEVLILDEPANGLDPEGVRWLRELVRGLAEQGRTILVSSHILAEVAQTVDSVVIIDHGRLVAQSSLEELTSGARRVVRVRTPRAQDLANALDHDGVRVERVASYRLEITGASSEQLGVLATAAGLTALATILGAARAGGSGHMAPPPLDTAAGLTAMLTRNGLGMLMAAVFGVTVSSGEFRHGTATTTYLGIPGRVRVLIAKAIVAAGFGLLFGLVAAGLTTGITLAFVAAKGYPVALGWGTIARFAAGAILGSGLLAAVGVGLGSLLRGQLAAIVTVFAWGFVVEQLIGGLFDSAQPYLPYTAATTMAGATLGGGTSALPFAAAAALVAGVAALLSAVAAQTTVQRDVA